MLNKTKICEVNILKKNITVKDLVKLLNQNENMYGASGKERLLGIEVNGKHIGYVKSIKLDGYGDGLITDIWLEIEAD